MIKFLPDAIICGLSAKEVISFGNLFKSVVRSGVGKALMQYSMLKCKLHRVKVTHSELDYEGSCAIDKSLMEAAGILEYEQIEIYNITNGERFSTYAILAEANSGIISVNGAAAHKADPGDLIIIAAYLGLNEKELQGYKPTLVYVDEHNRVHHTNTRIPVQAAS